MDRTFNRSLDDAVAFMRTRLQGRIVVLPVSLCLSVQACLWYRPSAGNAYHSEIHGPDTQTEPTVTVKSPIPLQLELRWAGGSKRLSIAPTRV